MEANDNFYVAPLNAAWRRQGIIRASLNALLALVFGWLFLLYGATWQLVLAIVFLCFFFLPLIFIRVFTPPACISGGLLQLRTPRRCTIPLNTVEHIEITENQSEIRLTLVTERTIKLPARLFEDPETFKSTLEKVRPAQ